MRTRYSITTDLQSFLLKEKKEQIQSVSKAIDYVLGVSGQHLAALEFLKEHGIQTRLDADEMKSEGLQVLAELREIRAELESQLLDLEISHTERTTSDY